MRQRGLWGCQETKESKNPWGTDYAQCARLPLLGYLAPGLVLPAARFVANRLGPLRLWPDVRLTLAALPR